MALRNNSKKNSGGGSNGGCLLLLAFMLLIVGLFLFNRETITKNLRDSQLIERVFKKDVVPPAKTPEVKPPTEAPKKAPETPPTTPVKEPPAKPIVPEKPAAEKTPETTKTETVKTVTEKPVVKTPTEKPKPAARDRSLWFVRVENDGVIARVKVKRSFALSDTPLVDVLNALMGGPSAAEEKKGYSSLIPSGTKLLSATVRGTTAYLSFNEAFQFNSFGIEGYAAQLRQIVWTATEFESVKDVQILIEGRRIDYLGLEGIFIGSPLSRESI